MSSSKMPRVLVLDDDDARHAVFSRILPDCSVLHVYTATTPRHSGSRPARLR
jgi:CheY-like chemotaxis protein